MLRALDTVLHSCDEASRNLCIKAYVNSKTKLKFFRNYKIGPQSAVRVNTQRPLLSNIRLKVNLINGPMSIELPAHFGALV